LAKLGENIQVRRFSRFVLGEGIEKEETDFADEVAAQTGQKPAAAEAASRTGQGTAAPDTATKEAKGTKKKGGKKKK
jgi:elongation factor Ts